jgi:hypothetical protein
MHLIAFTNVAANVYVDRFGRSEKHPAFIAINAACAMIGPASDLRLFREIAMLSFGAFRG